MKRAELKQQAKDTLKGRWGTIIAMVLLYEIIVSAISMVGNFIPGVGTIAVFIISVPLSFGFIGQIMKYSRNEEVGVVDFFSIGFKNFGKVWSIFGNTILKLLPYVICMIASIVFMVVSIIITTQNEDLEMFLILISIAVIIFFVIYIALIVKALLYAITDYIGNDNLNMTGKEIVEKSAELMKGHRWEYFMLGLSFIGWYILSIFTLGIGLLWLIPYIQVTTVKYYEYLAGATGNNNEVIIEK